MVKSRFTSLDVRAMVNSVRPAIVHCKLTNVYDINSKVYLLKLQRKGFKCFLLLESGVRFHLTSYDRDKSSIPSNYTMKLRKHIRTRRLTAIEQLGCDRCIDLTFGRGENSFHLILELYVSGNLLLTDHEYRILALLRTQTDQQSKVALRQIYPVDSALGLLTVPVAQFPDAIDDILNVVSQRQENQEIQEIEADDEKAKAASKKGESAFAKRSKKRVSHSAMPLVQLLHKLAPFADPALCAASICKALQGVGQECENAFKLSVEDFAAEDVAGLMQAAAEAALQTLQGVSRPGDLGGGGLPALEAPVDGDHAEAEGAEEEDEDDEAVDGGAGDGAEAAPLGPASAANAAEEAEAPAVPGWIVRRWVHVPPTAAFWANEEFTPLPPAGAAAEPEAAVAFASFHECVDEFYTRVEEHRAAESKTQHAKTVYDKVERIRADQGRRVEQLEAEQGVSERQALLIEANVELVERALFMVNTMVASQIDWTELWREVKRQQRLGHPIAQHIHALDLARNEIQFLLSGLVGSEDPEGEDDRPMEVVPLDLSLTPHANVARLHSRRKETREKTSRTLLHAEAAIKQAEKRAQQDMQKFELKQTIRRVRQAWWFEKFFWFISSENYLVIAGHDAQQTEHIFCKHLGPKDAFVQADVAGARSCFVRNPSGGVVPPATLREAGCLALCHSTAWDKRIVISAWWVPMEQVSRGSPPEVADFTAVDGFFVQGRRHFLPPVHLEMGFTLLFHVGEASAERHRGERRSRYLEAMGPEAEGADGDAESGEGPPVSPEAQAEEEDALEEAAQEHARAVAAAEDEAEGERSEDGPHESAPQGASGMPPCAVEAPDRPQRPEEAAAVAEPPSATSEATPEEHTPASGELGAAGETAAAAASGRGGGRISRAERKRLRRGGDGEGGQADGDAAPAAPAPAAPAPAAPAPAAPVASVAGAASAPAAAAPGGGRGPAAPLPRGQRAKAKKIKERYGDQDEDEKQLRLALLGSRETKRAQAAKAPDAAGYPAGGDGGSPVAAAAPAEAPAENVVPPAGPARGGAAPAPRDAPRDAAGGAAPAARRPAADGHARPRLTAGCEAEDGAPDLSQLGRLDLLTGQPRVEDEVLYAMAMVAPYCALGGPYAYRAKLTPGPGKKGQMARQCLRMFDAQTDRQAWKLLVQAIPENDAASLMMGSCKVSMPGMQKLQQQLQKDKKRDKQEPGKAPAR